MNEAMNIVKKARSSCILRILALDVLPCVVGIVLDPVPAIFSCVNYRKNVFIVKNRHERFEKFFFFFLVLT